MSHIFDYIHCKIQNFSEVLSAFPENFKGKLLFTKFTSKFSMIPRHVLS